MEEINPLVPGFGLDEPEAQWFDSLQEVFQFLKEFGLAKRQTNYLLNGERLLVPWGERGRNDMKLTAHSHLLPTLRMSGLHDLALN